MRKLIERMRKIGKEYGDAANKRGEKKIDKFLCWEIEYIPNLVNKIDYYRLGYDSGVADALSIMSSRVEGKLNEGS